MFSAMASRGKSGPLLVLVVFCVFLSGSKSNGTETLHFNGISQPSEFECLPNLYATCGIGAASGLLLEQQRFTNSTSMRFSCPLFQEYTMCLGKQVAGGDPCTVSGEIPEFVNFLGSEIDCEEDEISTTGLHDGCDTGLNYCTDQYVENFFFNPPTSEAGLQAACSEFYTWKDECDEGFLEAGCLAHALAFDIIDTICGYTLIQLTEDSVEEQEKSRMKRQAEILDGGSGDGTVVPGTTVAPVVRASHCYRVTWNIAYSEDYADNNALIAAMEAKFADILRQDFTESSIIGCAVSEFYDVNQRLGTEFCCEYVHYVLSSEEFSYAKVLESHISSEPLILAGYEFVMFSDDTNSGFSYTQTNLDDGSTEWLTVGDGCNYYYENEYCRNNAMCAVYVQSDTSEAAPVARTKLYCDCDTGYEGLRCDIPVTETVVNENPASEVAVRLRLDVVYTEDLNDPQNPARIKLIEELENSLRPVKEALEQEVGGTVTIVIDDISRGSVTVVPRFQLPVELGNDELMQVSQALNNELDGFQNSITIGGEPVGLTETPELIILDDNLQEVAIPIAGVCFLFDDMNVCNNGGECFENAAAVPECSCPEGTYGDYCENIGEESILAAEVLAAIVVIVALAILACSCIIYACLRRNRNRGLVQRRVFVPYERTAYTTPSAFSSIYNNSRYSPGSWYGAAASRPFNAFNPTHQAIASSLSRFQQSNPSVSRPQAASVWPSAVSRPPPRNQQRAPSAWPSAVSNNFPRNQQRAPSAWPSAVSNNFPRNQQRAPSAPYQRQPMSHPAAVFAQARGIPSAYSALSGRSSSGGTPYQSRNIYGWSPR